MSRFPLSFTPKLGYHKGSGSRWFGAKRSSGRKHAACDLIAKVGTPIYAVDDGVILKKYYFYHDTYALEVQHTNFLVRYGEIDKKLPSGIKVGSTVKQGDVIAEVGQLSGGSSMLHFEMYKGTATGNLTQRKNTTFDYVTGSGYQRRSDLLDPTPYLDTWRLWTQFTDWFGEIF